MAKIKDDNELLSKASDIRCVSDYVNILEYINNPISLGMSYPRCALFFRGVGREKAYGEDIPSIYRLNKSARTAPVEFEDSLYYEMISRCPEDFKHCNTTLEHLVMMQHYGLPTRLLDVTENPLVALYFACKDNNQDENAAVKIFLAKNELIKNYASDTASIISNLAKLKVNQGSLPFHMNDITNKFKDIIYKGTDPSMELFLLSVLMSEIKQQYKKIDESSFLKLPFYWYFVNSLYYLIPFKTEPKYQFLADELNFIKTDIEDHPLLEQISLKSEDCYEIVKDVERFFQFVKAEKPYFDPEKFKVYDLEKVLFVRTKKDNPNIIRQNGAFILFGLADKSVSKTSCARIPNDQYYSVFRNGKSEKVTCLIKPEYKKNIIQELDVLSISESQLFPDIASVAKYLKNKYS